jgi:hypothetical protein
MNISQKTPTPKSLPLLVAVLALIVGLLAACTGLEDQPGPTSATGTSTNSPFEPTTTTPRPEPTGPLLAYRAADEIGVVDGTTVIGSVRGAFTPSNDLITTEDGKFMFARTSDDQLATLDVATGKGTVRPVAVGPSLGTGGASTIVWWEQPNRLMRLDLANPASQPELDQSVELPPVPGVRLGWRHPRRRSAVRTRCTPFAAAPRPHSVRPTRTARWQWHGSARTVERWRMRCIAARTARAELRPS